MMTNPNPMFVPGSRVISFRGERATVLTVRAVPEPGKSHRCQVIWDDMTQNPDAVEYYEEVFEFDENAMDTHPA